MPVFILGNWKSQRFKKFWRRAHTQNTFTTIAYFAFSNEIVRRKGGQVLRFCRVTIGFVYSSWVSLFFSISRTGTRYWCYVFGIYTGITWYGCNTTWHNFSRTSITGLVTYSQYQIFDDCLAACAYLERNCVATVVRPITAGTIECYMSFSGNSVFNKIANPYVDLFVLYPKCSSNEPG